MTFKVGDIVIYDNILKNGGSTDVIGHEARVESWSGDCGTVVFITGSRAGASYGSHVSELKLKNNIHIMKDIKERFTLAFKQEPEKSFRKTGITNGDDFLTDDGQKVFLAWLLKKHGEEFKTDVVDDLLKDLEDSKK